MNTELCFGQRYDEQLGILEPWYTNPAMDKIKTWDLSDKVVMEWGGGASTIWWATKAKKVYSVDHNIEWFDLTSKWLSEKGLNSKYLLNRIDTHEGDQPDGRDAYVKCYPDKKFDICIVDGVHRYECAEYAVKVLKPEILIIDNWQQAFIFMCPAAVDLLKDYRCEIFTQENHEDHDGVNKWKTGIWYLNEKALP